MNTLAETRSGREQDQVEAGSQDGKPAQDAELFELGKVSDTKGGWLGVKPDTGNGWQTY